MKNKNLCWYSSVWHLLTASAINPIYSSMSIFLHILQDLKCRLLSHCFIGNLYLYIYIYIYLYLFIYRYLYLYIYHCIHLFLHLTILQGCFLFLIINLYIQLYVGYTNCSVQIRFNNHRSDITTHWLINLRTRQTLL